jgi:hypothetical protein
VTISIGMFRIRRLANVVTMAVGRDYSRELSH